MSVSARLKSTVKITNRKRAKDIQRHIQVTSTPNTFNTVVYHEGRVSLSHNEVAPHTY